MTVVDEDRGQMDDLRRQGRVLFGTKELIWNVEGPR